MVLGFLVASLFASQAPKVEGRSLMALTPVLDGVISEEEWLPFASSDGTRANLQWEPGAVFFSAVVPEGNDLILDLDVNGDGWLNGSDNTELRIAQGPRVTARTMDATPRPGPAWKQKNASNVSVFTTDQGDHWVVEGRVTLDASRTIRQGRTIGAFIESVPSSADTGPAFLPRTMQYVTLGFDGADSLPEGMAWRSATRLREVARDDRLSMNFELSGDGDFRSYELRCEGSARASLATITRPFSGFDGKGSATLEYRSDISPDASAGWRILRATVFDAADNAHTVRTSFRIADLIEFDVNLSDRLEYSDGQRTLKGQLIVRSTGVGRVEGDYAALVPQTWQTVKGGPQKILIFNPRARERISLEFVLPPGATGDFPITFTVSVGVRTFAKSVVVTVDPPAG